MFNRMKILGIFIWRKNRHLLHIVCKCSFHFQRRRITCFYCLCEQSKVLNAFFQKFFLVLLRTIDNRMVPESVKGITGASTSSATEKAQWFVCLLPFAISLIKKKHRFKIFIEECLNVFLVFAIYRILI